MIEDSSPLRLMGVTFTHEEFRSQCVSGDNDLEKLIVSQIMADQNNGAAHSEGLMALDLAWSLSVKRFLARDLLRNQPDAIDEVWNATLLKIYERISGFDPERSRFKTWVYNHARYAALNECRRLHKEKRLKKHIESQPTDVVTYPLEPSLLTRRETSAVKRALTKLSDTERKLIELRLIEGLSYDEIAGRLGDVVKREHLRIVTGRAIARFAKFAKRELERYDDRPRRN